MLRCVLLITIFLQLSELTALHTQRVKSDVEINTNSILDGSFSEEFNLDCFMSENKKTCKIGKMLAHKNGTWVDDCKKHFDTELEINSCTRHFLDGYYRKNQSGFANVSNWCHLNITYPMACSMAYISYIGYGSDALCELVYQEGRKSLQACKLIYKDLMP